MKLRQEKDLCDRETKLKGLQIDSSFLIHNFYFILLYE